MGHTNINWIKEAVGFLTGLYPIKKEKDFTRIYAQSVDLIRKHAHARSAAIVRMEDQITVRVLYSTSSDFVQGFVDAEAVIRLADVNKIVFDKDSFFPSKDGEAVVFFPINEGLFVGGVLLLIDDSRENDSDFLEFLDDVWVGIKETASLVQHYFKLEELSIRFGTILETIPEGIVFVDDMGRNGWVNSVASEILGLPREKNKPVAIATAMQKLRDTAVNKDEINKQGTRLFSLPGQKITDWKWVFGNPVDRVLSVSCVPTISENIKGRLWVFSDVTFEYLANEKLQALNEELAEKRKIADEQNKAKSDFLANMSHEIRTPMNGVIGMASLLVNTELTEEQIEYVDTIRISGEALIAIINDILDFSKIESGRMDLENHPLYINTVIEETYDLLSVKANEKGLDLLYYIEPDVPAEINGDVTRLRQIMINLVSNGIKFTEKGEIQVSVRNKGQDAQGYYNIEFEVKDTGIGIPKDKYHRLFDSFSQVDSSTTRRYGGTGLGLAICQRLVTLMGGSIHVDSEEDKGTSFIFNIKVEANRKMRQYEARVTSNALPDKGKRILVLDDNKTNLKILRKQCAAWGFEATTFDNYAAALQALEQDKYNLVIIDMIMPDKDGIEVTKIIKEKYKDMPVILFSSSGNYPAASDADKGMFAAILNKPAKHSNIHKTISDVLNKTVKPVIVSATKIAAIEKQMEPINILIADDVDINRKLLIRALEKLGYNADMVENGKEVLSAMEQKKYQLIFMDVMMPEMDGYEAARIIAEEYGKRMKPVIIATTAKALSDDRDKAMQAGMDDYISKPFKVQDVKDKLEKWKAKIIEKL